MLTFIFRRGRWWFRNKLYDRSSSSNMLSLRWYGMHFRYSKCAEVFNQKLYIFCLNNRVEHSTHEYSWHRDLGRRVRVQSRYRSRSEHLLTVNHDLNLAGRKWKIYGNFNHINYSEPEKYQDIYLQLSHPTTSSLSISFFFGSLCGPSMILVRENHLFLSYRPIISYKYLL